MSGPILTFSGAHPYRPQCVLNSARAILGEVLAGPDAEALAMHIAERVTTAVDSSVCPRCSDPLAIAGAPEGWRPAGSRATTCRCIPVCETCSSWAEPMLGLLAVTGWPTDFDDGEDLTRKEIEADLIEQAKARAQTAVLEVGPEGAVLVTAEGTAPFLPLLRPHPGGWLEHGYDDTDDEQERGR
ncbi:hypothetical protein QCN29_26955 [Streptomyces sp. HNM0663]|uniref:Uncharacterized protein n=1 Tax=Streptomyces chengmaiensis TaxID=3040919 RepID=A0ABT6HUG3_9ACTN|nr:hypothetical protein [Streptomyces chengmaiensis]MDH2392352.1 hypothetical protein [Streptomyces chengmaiensis]